MRSGREPGIRSTMLNLLLVFVSSVIGLLLVEAGLRLHFFKTLASPTFVSERLLHQPHRTRGWALVPNATANAQRLGYRTRIHVNSKGLTDDEHDYEPEPGVFRIVLLGDSFMQAEQVNLHQSFAYLLEELLSRHRVEVINLGVNGFNTAQEYQILKEEGLKYQPDLVLLAVFTQNDVPENSRDLTADLYGTKHTMTVTRLYAVRNNDDKSLDFLWPPYEEAVNRYTERTRSIEEAQGTARLLQRTLIYNVLHDWLEARRVLADASDPSFRRALFGTFLTSFDGPSETETMGSDEQAAIWDDTWSLTFRLFEAIHEMARVNGAKFAMFQVPGKAQVDEKYQEKARKEFPDLSWDPDLPGRRLGTFAQEAAIPFLDLVPIFRERSADGGGTLFLPIRDGHWGVHGHRVASEEVAAFLKRESLLETSRAPTL